MYLHSCLPSKSIAIEDTYLAIHYVSISFWRVSSLPFVFGNAIIYLNLHLFFCSVLHIQELISLSPTSPQFLFFHLDLWVSLGKYKHSSAHQFFPWIHLAHLVFQPFSSSCSSITSVSHALLRFFLHIP